MARNLKDILWYFRYFVSRTMWWGLFVRYLHCTYIYVALTVFSHSHYGYCKSFCRIDDKIPCLMLWSEGWLPLPIRLHTPTQLTMYCVFQIHYFDGWWDILRVKLCLLNCVHGWWEISINLCVIIFGNYIIFGQAELYGLFGFKFYSDYHLNYIYIHYCCFWLVVFCYVLLCISLCVYCKFMCIRMY